MGDFMFDSKMNFVFAFVFEFMFIAQAVAPLYRAQSTSICEFIPWRNEYIL